VFLKQSSPVTTPQFFVIKNKRLFIIPYPAFQAIYVTTKVQSGIITEENVIQNVKSILINTDRKSTKIILCFSLSNYVLAPLLE